MSSAARQSRQQRRGFTLIELIIVVAIIGILAMIAMPAMTNAPRRAREAVLKENLFQMRSCIDQYLADHGEYPESLQALVDAGYLRRIPEDPIAQSEEWEEIPVDPETDEDLQPHEGVTPGIMDVKSKSEGSTLDGVPYSEL
jgi:general secretion pathway protein G